MDHETASPTLVKSQTERKKRFLRKFHHPVVAWVILCISLTLTIIAYFFSSSMIQKKAEEQFNFRTKEISQAIEDRLRVYEQVLWSGVAFVNATKELNRENFTAFVETLDINKHWPGIQGIGFSVPVSPEEKEAHIATIRHEGFPDFTIKPEGKRPMYSSIIYLVPFDWRNQRAFGYDMWSNELRRAAMKRAMEQGRAATSSMITLVQETSNDIQKGFLTYVPVYNTRVIPGSKEERIAHFVGWVYAPFRAGDLMHGILGSKDSSIDFEIFDGANVNKKALLYSSHAKPSDPQQDQTPTFTHVKTLNLQGHYWTLHFQAPKQPNSSGLESLPRYIAIAGTVIDFLLFYVIFSLHFINQRTDKLIQRRTQDLQNAKKDLEEVVQERTAELIIAKDNLEHTVHERTQALHDKISELELINQVTMDREERIVELKKTINELSLQLNRPLPYKSVISQK